VGLCVVREFSAEPFQPYASTGNWLEFKHFWFGSMITEAHRYAARCAPPAGPGHALLSVVILAQGGAVFLTLRVDAVN
jgi:hypothetical protein